METLYRERLAFDPIFKHAEDVADDLLGSRDFQPSSYKGRARSYIGEHRSPTQRKQFLDALRKEMHLWMERHRPDCDVQDRPEQCQFEICYATIVRIIQDELEELDPSIAHRSPGGSFSREEADQVMKLLNELRDQLQAMESNIQTGQQVAYDLLSEDLEDLSLKLSLGKKDFGAVLIGRVKDAIAKRGIEFAIVEPLVKEITRIAQGHAF